MAVGSVVLVGIVNVTPDSFSDGGSSYSAADAIAHARKLVSDGADMIDIGGDSTRPGSKCVGVEEEWRRIGDVVGKVREFAAVSVDTHQAEVARRAIQAGAEMINDVSAGSDPEMFPLIQETGVKYVMMHSCCDAPHRFGAPNPMPPIDRAESFLSAKLDQALKAGIKRDRIVFDPGMGAFLAPGARDSWELIRKIEKLESYFPLMIGASRKGFLKTEGERSPNDRDPVTSLIGAMIAQKFSFRLPLYLRVHNVSLQRDFLEKISNFF